MSGRMAEDEVAALRREIEMLKGLSGEGSGQRRTPVKSPEGASSTHGHSEGASLASAHPPASSFRSLSQPQIREVFEFYANFGRSAVMTYQDSLDSFMFMKFAKECPGLLDSTITPTEIDLIFVKAKPKFERRLDFEHFLDALAAIAERRYPDVSPREGLKLMVHHHLAPHYDLVQEEMQKTGETEVPLSGVFKKLYDPRSYTGVYAERFRSGDGRINGEADARPARSYKGSTNTGTDDIIHDVSVLMRPNLHGSGTMLSPVNHTLARNASSPRMKAATPTLSRMQSPTSGARSVRSTSTSRRAEEVPSLASPPASRRPVGGPTIAASIGDQSALLAAAMERAKAGDPSQLMSLSLALAQQVKSMQGGSEAGRPTESRERAAARQEIDELQQDITTLQASLHEGADHRTLQEVKDAIELREQRISDLEAGVGRPTAVLSPKPMASMRSPRVFKFTSAELGEPRSMDTGSVVSTSGPALNQDQIREIFDFYCNFGRSAVMTYQDSLDSFMFMKFAKECPDMIDRRLTSTEIDLIFMKAKPKFERRLQFTHFLDALSAIAERKYPEYSPTDGLRLLIANQLAPLYDMVQAEMQKTGETEIPLAGVFKKLYDPRNYTGVYAERFRTGDGRINGESDNRPGREFNGNTNTQTDEIIHDISTLMRPHLRSGTMMRSRPVTPGGSPSRLARSASPRRGLVSPGGGMDAHSVASRR